MFKLFPILLISSGLFATYGHTFKIEEENMAEVILKKLPSALEDTTEKTIARLKNPPPVPNLQEAREYRAFYFDPIYTVQEEITDLKGNIIAEKGKLINPMEKIEHLQDLILFDGTNPKHIEWAQSQEKAKWILVKGSPLEIEEESDHPVFFDQGGFICQKFAIEKIPTKISKKGSRLLIEEIPCDF